MPQDILIVEDNREHLDSLRLQVRLDLQVEPFVSDDPIQALEIIRDYRIKVIVTDWDLPNMTGIELFHKVKEELQRDIPCILVTGYADKISLNEAVNAGFFRFIDKLQIQSQLTTAIRDALRRYEMDHFSTSELDVQAKISGMKRFSVIRPRIWRPNVTLSLTKVTSIVDPYVKDIDWKTDYYAERGVSRTVEINISHRAKAYYEHGLRAEVSSKVGFSLKSAVGSLELVLQPKLASWITEKYEEEVEVNSKHIIDVKEITDDSNDNGARLLSREYQSAPVYVMLNCIFELDCSCCQVSRQFDVPMFLPTRRIALRQVEHYDKGKERTIYTGLLSQGD